MAGSFCLDYSTRLFGRLLKRLLGFRDWIPAACADYDLKLFSFAITWWSLRVSRNKMRMERKFPNHPGYSIYLKMQKVGVGGGAAKGDEQGSF
jgi:hypothetical protein